MKYGELSTVRDLLNKKFKGKQLAGTEYTIRDFVVIPDVRHDKVTHERFKIALELGVPLAEVEKTIDTHAHLDIMIRFTNAKAKIVYPLSEFGFTIEQLEHYTFK